MNTKMDYTGSNNGEILLNNFQIRKHRYKVLCNYSHIVWERLDGRHSQRETADGNTEAKIAGSTFPTTTAPAEIAATAVLNEDAVYERDLPSCSARGSISIINLHDVIKVSKGPTKSKSVVNAYLYKEALKTLYGGRPQPDHTFLAIHFAERIVASPTDCNRWRIRCLIMENDDANIVLKWHDHLVKLLGTEFRRQVRRVLIFVNPVCGSKLGPHIFDTLFKRILILAGIRLTCFFTQAPNHIRDSLETSNLPRYDAVCCVGGDGTVAEMINGLILRAINDHGLDPRNPEYIPKPSVAIGIIPAGSTDAIAYSVHGTSDLQTAIIHLVLGQRRGLDVCSIRNQEGILRFCTSAMGYGYLGDVAAKSEKYRWMGPKRYEYTGVKAFLLNRGYEAEIQLLLNEDEQTDAGASALSIAPSYGDTICHTECPRCKSDINNSLCDDNERQSSSTLTLCTRQMTDDNSSIKTHNENFQNSDQNICNEEDCINPMENHAQNDDVSNDEETKTKLPKASGSVASVNAKQELKKPEQPDNFSLTKSERERKWRTISGKFFMITAANITCACARSPNGISRYCHLGDGYLDIVLVRKTNFFNNIRLVFNIMARCGDVRKLPFVEIYRTRQFKFKAKASSRPQNCNSVAGSSQPITENCNEQETPAPNELYSSWNCDGEVVTDLDLTMTTHRQLLDVYMRGPYIYSKPVENMRRKCLFCCCCGQ